MTRKSLVLTFALALASAAPAVAQENFGAADNPGSSYEQDHSGGAPSLEARRGRGWGRGPGWGRGWDRGPGWGRRCFARDAFGQSFNNVRQCMNFSGAPQSCRRVCF